MAGERGLSELLLFSAEGPGANELQRLQDGEKTARALNFPRASHQQDASAQILR